MRTEHALRYLLLKHLWKLRGSVDEQTRGQVARSLAVARGADGAFRISWTRAGDAHRVERPAGEFQFYRRGDVLLPLDGGVEARTGLPADAAARQLAADMLGVAVAAPAGRPATSLYLDAWRWPTACAIAGAVALLASGDVVQAVFAATAALELAARSPWIWVPFAAALVAASHTLSAIVIAAFLVLVASLATPGRRGWIDAAPFVGMLFLAWSFRADPIVSHGAPAVIAAVAVVSVTAWAVFWLWYEGHRLSMLLAPLLAVTFVFEGRVDLAVWQLTLCTVYSLWLVALPFQRRDP